MLCQYPDAPKSPLVIETLSFCICWHFCVFLNRFVMSLSKLTQTSALGRLASSLRPAISASWRGFAAEPAPEESTSITLEVNPFKGHKVEPPSNQVETNKDELFDMYRTMFLMRRMELTADQLYKQKLARGFLHLADGQEGVPVGMEAALDFDDSMIQSYRDHCRFSFRNEILLNIKHVAICAAAMLILKCIF